jgi:hypothetical protein
MSRLVTMNRRAWNDSAADRADADPIGILEAGDVLFFPSLPFAIERDEAAVFTPGILGSSKNTSYDPAGDRVSGTTATGRDAEILHAMLRRFTDAAQSLVADLLRGYRGGIERRRASFRPAEIAGRATSWRKDDTRLHVDSFPASPSSGRRILRVFTNVNPAGRVRAWRIGDDFDRVAERFADRLRPPFPGSGHVLQWLRITKGRRSPYDALMLQLHDRMKADADFQQRSPQSSVDFPAGTTWMAFTDQVSHAAMAGQHQLEQTFLVSVSALRSPERSPLRILERLKGRALV